MLLAALLEWPATKSHMFQVLDSKIIPNISEMQAMLQRAWAKGFSQYAAAELDRSVADSSKWIGTTEIQALFSFQYIECYIKDFSHGTVKTAVAQSSRDVARATKVQCGQLQRAMYKFVHDYFLERMSSEDGFIPPLYIQYEGHSRTIIGLDITEQHQEDPQKQMEKVGFLLFDPANTQWDVELKGKEKPTRRWYKEKVFCAMTTFKVSQSEFWFSVLFVLVYNTINQST